MVDYKMYIDGQWTGEQLAGKIPVVNPATEEVIASVPKGGADEARLAVDAAHRAFETWSAQTAWERGALLHRWHRLIEENKEELARILTREQGKPLKEALGEIDYANSFIAWYAEEGKRIYGDLIPSANAKKKIVVNKQPVGVVAVITPWNFPAAMITRKVAPALAAGCTVVIKPAELTPLTALKLAELAEKAGIPKGVINVVTGDPQEIGDAWLKDQRVRKLTFTGSTAVGKHLMGKASETVKRVSLELGGHAPFIIMADADLDQAVQHVIASKFRNAGQTCICANRIYVDEKIEKAFVEKLIGAVAALKVGNGLEADTDIGPLINPNALKKVKEQIEDAVRNGASVAIGGQERKVNGKGHFFEPTILTNVTDQMICMKEETFGPVAPIATFRDENEVIERANALPYGLAAYVFTSNLGSAIRMGDKLEFGVIGINDGLPSVAQAPFGGFKESGIGREGGYYGLEEFLEVKYLSIAF